MASWLHPEKKRNQNLNPSLHRKSRIPVRMTRPSRESDRRFSSKHEADSKARLQRNSVNKPQNKRSSRNPIVVREKKTKVDTKVGPAKIVKITGVGKPLRRDSGTNLRETQRKQDKKEASAIPSTTAICGSLRCAQKTTPNVKRRISRQRTPIDTESKQVCKDGKDPRVITEELQMYRRTIETLQADLDESKVDIKRLQLKEEYQERELANLKCDFKRKERKWDEGNKLVEKVMADINELWDDVDYLEERLKHSQESNEDLTFETDELKITIQEMKKEYRVEHSRGGCGHLREEVELLNGSLELNEQRVALLESQVDAFKAERKELLEDVDYLEERLKNSQESNEDLTFEVDELKITIQEMKEYGMEHSRGGCGHLREKVELLNGSLALNEQRVVVLERQLHELKCETSKTISELNDEIAKLQKEKSTSFLELSKELEEDKNVIEEIRQERCDKDHLELQSERIRELETQIQRMEDIKRNAIHLVDALVLEARQERSESEIAKLTREKDREFKIDLLLNGLQNIFSESSREENTFSTLETRKEKAALYQMMFLEDESNVAASGQGDTKNKWVNTSGMEKRFETRGNRASDIAEVHHTMRKLSAHGSSKKISILLCKG
ncbi:myosin-2-like [Stylophora pistillata]|uniref:Uncharacterized protein n=1 Tax=Stylophora pistillata TaxID=50429 RepID=A0A2B4SN46_STYPI|nr:myosin-2-like [Stylophora pistillata]PFX29835.1 hypothetical protein AWC38_SpisGene5335 [Stylophora pistillata]